MDNTTTLSSSQPSLDPQAVQLAQSIRQVESGGNFQAKGKSGEYGAYQFEPATWQAEAPAAGVNVPLDQATPEQQNQVAYTKIKQLKDSGQNVGQIASTWNAGNPDAYLNNNIGTNAEGVAYDTPAYAQKVAQTYQSIKGGQPIPDGVTNSTGASKETDGMPTWEKIALGLGGTALGVGAVATANPELLPEAGEAISGALPDIGEGISNIAGKVVNGVKGFLGNTIKSAVPFGIADEVVNGVLGNKTATATQNAGDEQANATEDAGTAEANATQQAEQQSTEEQEMLADEASAKKAIADATTGANALNQSFIATPTGKLLMQDPLNQQTVQNMSVAGYLPDTSQGINDFGTKSNTGAFAKSWDDLNSMSGGIKQVLGEEGKTGLVSDALQAGYENGDQYIPTPQREEAQKYMDKISQDYYKRYGDGHGGMSLENMELAKRELYQLGGKWDASRSSAHTQAIKSLAKGFRNTIEKNTSHKDLYNRVMKKEQEIFQAQKLMKKMDGKKALEHKGFFRGVLKSYGKYVGTYIGDKIGGPLGAVVGTMVGDHLTKAVDKRFGKTYFESKEGRKLLEVASKKSPFLAKTLKKELHKYGVKAEEYAKEVKNRLQLPERTQSGMVLHEHGTQVKEREKKLGLLEVKNTKKNRTTSRTMSQGLIRKKSEGR